MYRTKANRKHTKRMRKVSITRPSDKAVRRPGEGMSPNHKLRAVNIKDVFPA